LGLQGPSSGSPFTTNVVSRSLDTSVFFKQGYLCFPDETVRLVNEIAVAIWYLPLLSDDRLHSHKLFAPYSFGKQSFMSFVKFGLICCSYSITHEFYLEFPVEFLHISFEMETGWISDATSETQTEESWANRSDELGRSLSNFNGPAQRFPSLPSVSHGPTGPPTI